MMGFKPKRGGVSSPVQAGGGGGYDAKNGWEIRPGGMFVQRRTTDSDKCSNINVGVKYCSSYHEIIPHSPHANSEELKKSRASPTELQENGRDSKKIVAAAGMKDGSKITLMEDDLSREGVRRVRGEEIQKASREITAVGFEVDNLAKQVVSVEMEINGGYKVVDTDLSNLIELLMTQLIKLDGIEADGEAKMQRRMQVKRVQKYIEVLDLLKIRNSVLEKMPMQKEMLNGRGINEGAARWKEL